jgi:type I restriction enzyme M protein
MSELRQIPIPLFESSKQREIEALFLRSRESALQAKESYIQAENLMSRTLNLGSSDFNRPIGYRASFKEAQRSLRFDAERYYPEFDRLISNLPVGAITAPLGSLLHYCRRGKQPIYSDRGLPVLNSKHVLENRIVLEGNRFAVQPADRSTEIRFGDVLINGTGRGTIGRAAPYLVPNNSAIPDNHVTILRSAELDPAYLAFYLNSLAGKLQVEMHQRGSSGQLELYPFDIRKFRILVAPMEVQEEIRRLSDFVTESAVLSRQLLEQARARVEQLIEEAVAA